MAGAFAQILAGDRLDVLSAGNQPTEKLNPLMVEVMQEKGIDMGFRLTASIESVLATEKPDLIISMGRCDTVGMPDDIPHELWNFTEPEDLNVMRQVRDAIEAKVAAFIKGMASFSFVGVNRSLIHER
jgi:protein-tyrosine-phosphatase